MKAWHRFSAASLMFLAAVTDAWCGPLVVIASSTPAFEAGRMLEGSEVITVAPGTRLTLVAADGRTIKLRGPFRGAPEPGSKPADTGLLAALSRILDPGAGPKPVLGTSRGGGGASVWSVDVGRPGRYCVDANEPPTLTDRAPADRSFILIIEYDGSPHPVTWPAGSRSVAWPAGAPLVEGGRYRLRFGPDDRGQPFELGLVPGDLPSDAHRAVWMADHDCMQQARRLLRDMARDEG